jgi:hypothetical protein
VAHRLAGFLAALLMLHLTIVRADSACASHGSAHDAAAMHMPHATHHPGNESGHGQQHTPPCDTPTRADCCQALASCSVAIANSDARTATFIPRATRGVIADTVRTPPSQILPPEPPPPKA